MHSSQSATARPDVDGGQQIDLSRPLSQQNKHQQGLEQRVNSQTQPILQQQHRDQVPLSQQNSHQPQYTPVQARPDVNIHNTSFRQQSTQHQNSVVVPQPRQTPIIVNSQPQQQVYVPIQQQTQNSVVVPQPRQTPILVNRQTQQPVLVPTTSQGRSTYPVRLIPTDAPTGLGLFLALVLICAAVAISIFAVSMNVRRYPEWA